MCTSQRTVLTRAKPPENQKMNSIKSQQISHESFGCGMGAHNPNQNQMRRTWEKGRFEQDAISYIRRSYKW